ncbi:hypothetical protein S245_055785, partial [Arachis hypogaea]
MASQETLAVPNTEVNALVQQEFGLGDLGLINGHETPIPPYGSHQWLLQSFKLKASKLLQLLLLSYEKVLPSWNVILKNEYQSSKLCEALYTNCEDMMDRLQVLRLPSKAKFNAGLQNCTHSFENECVRPSKTNYEQRITKMLGKSKSQFIKDYNQRLFNWLVAFSLVMIVIGRFIIKFILIEMGAWLLFIFLETYTRITNLH